MALQPLIVCHQILVQIMVRILKIVVEQSQYLSYQPDLDFETYANLSNLMNDILQ